MILYVAHDMLLSLIPDVRSLFHPNPAHVASRSIHQKCLTLLLAQVMMGPIKNFERYIEALNNPDEEEHRMPKRLEPIKKVIHTAFALVQSCAKEYRKIGLYVVKWP